MTSCILISKFNTLVNHITTAKRVVVISLLNFIFFGKKEHRFEIEKCIFIF